MSKPFIRIYNKHDQKDYPKDYQNGWGIENKHDLPIVNEKIPVISVIGTARDGKSTILNCYHNFINIIHKKNNAYNKSPFKFADGQNTCTDGIDFYKTDCYMLMDYEGMMHESVKYDHYLAIIAYLVSNVIIFNVRKRLDMQIMNNLLPVFSFLAEIPDEYRRKFEDKPILLIRITDFQDVKKLKENKNCLQEMLHDWLISKNDQYDKIKEAFNANFDIKIDYTCRPIMDEECSFDVTNEDFFKNNPTFTNFLSNLATLSYGKTPPSLLKSKENIIDLVEKLKKNDKIDWKKLDLYHQIITADLNIYAKNILSGYLTDNTIITKMDGMKDASIFGYRERETMINAAIKEAANKFKDISQSARDEVFVPIFDNLKKIAEESRQLNHKKALEYIKPYHDTFKQRYVNYGEWKNVVTDILFWHDESKKVFDKTLDLIDVEISAKIKNEMILERNSLIKLQDEINKKNKEVVNKINSEIEKYKPKGKFYDYMYEEIDAALTDNRLYNEGIKLLDKVTDRIKHDMKKIFDDNKRRYYLKGDMTIGYHIDRMDFDWEKRVPKSNKYNADFWSYVDTILEKIGFLPIIKFFSILNEIEFVRVKCYDIKFVVSKKMFDNKNMLQKIKDVIDDYSDNEYVILYKESKPDVVLSPNKHTIDIEYPKNMENMFLKANHLRQELTKKMVKFLVGFCCENNMVYHDWN